MPASDDHRRAHLVWAIQHILVKPGGTVQAAGPYDAVILGRGMRHGVHVVLTVLFFGFWLPIWLLCAATYKRSVYHLSVDERGQLSIADATRNQRMGMAPDGTLFYA